MTALTDLQRTRLRTTVGYLPSTLEDQVLLSVVTEIADEQRREALREAADAYKTEASDGTPAYQNSYPDVVWTVRWLKDRAERLCL